MKNFASGESRAKLVWPLPSRDVKWAKPICFRATSYFQLSQSVSLMIQRYDIFKPHWQPLAGSEKNLKLFFRVPPCHPPSTPARLYRLPLGFAAFHRRDERTAGAQEPHSSLSKGPFHNHPTFLVLRKASTLTPNPFALSRAGA